MAFAMSRSASDLETGLEKNGANHTGLACFPRLLLEVREDRCIPINLNFQVLGECTCLTSMDLGKKP